jgi:hypothetical protein
MTKFVCTNGCLGKDGKPKAFTTKQNLERHLKTPMCKDRKSVPNVYHCKYCNWTAPDKTAFTKHCDTELHTETKWMVLYEKNKHKKPKNKIPFESKVDQSWIDDWHLENDKARKNYMEDQYEKDRISLHHDLKLAQELYAYNFDYEDLRDELYRIKDKYVHFKLDTDDLGDLNFIFKWKDIPKDW